MGNAQSFADWQARWDALAGHLAALSPAADFPRKETIRILGECLQKFGQNQFNFFKNGFNHNPFPSLETSADYPPDFALNTILLQVGFDVGVLERLISGRRSGQAQALETADLLAQLALRPAVEAGLVEEAAVLSYFNKSANIRIIPYARVALVATPRTVTTLRRDFLAVPHEVGHYLFRNGRAGGESIVNLLRQAVAGEPDWLKRWLEEIFADVYGCLIGGPVMDVDFQDLLLDESRPRFLEDDGEHPVPPIRPFIYRKVLAEMGFGAYIESLNGRWNEWLARRLVSLNDEFTLFAPEADGDERLSLLTARYAVERVVETILDTALKPLADARRGQFNRFWTGAEFATSPPPPGTDIAAALYTEFSKDTAAGFLNEVKRRAGGQTTPVSALLAELHEVAADKNKVEVRRGGRARGSQWTKGLTGRPDLDALLSRSDHNQFVRATTWETLLSTDGWNVRGPENNWP